ncbi:MAG TPA: response regulator [Blastocatellia bacterium]|nr:response regulator [Blastocatellia bacterium]
MQAGRGDRIRAIFEEIARGLNLDRALGLIAEQVATEVVAPTCKIWVVKRGDICEHCPLATTCTNREICLHLVAASGASIDKEYPRIPLSIFNATMLSRGGASDFSDSAGPGEKLFGLQHGAGEVARDSYAISPLRGPSGILGIIGIFNHRPMDQGEAEVLTRYAPSAVAAIRIAELQSRCDLLRAQNEKQASAAAAAARSAADRERSLQDVGIQITEQLSKLQAELNRVQAERDAVVLESAEALQRVELLEDENKSLRERAEELMTLQQESSRAYSEWAAQLESERNRLEEKSSALGERVKVLEEHAASFETTREEFSTQLAERNTVIEGLRNELEARSAELSDAKDVAARFENRVAILEQTNAGLRDHGSALTEGIDDLERSLRIAEDARARSEQIRVGLASKTAELTVEVEQSRVETVRLSGENEQLLSEIDRIRRDLSATRVSGEKLGDETITLKAVNEELAVSKGRAEARVTELEQEGSRLVQANTQLEDVLRRYEVMIERLEEDGGRFRNRAEASDRTRSEIEQRYRVLVEQNRRLQIQGQNKARFLANMSHELRTPMNAIIGFTSLLIEDAALQVSDRHRRNLERISRNARDLLQLINNVLDLSKIDAGRMDVYSEPTEVRDLIERALIVVEPLRQGRQIELIVDVSESIPTLRTDRIKLQQVLINLLSNAIKFTPHGEVRIKAESKGLDRVRISVSDTGVGIAEADIPKVFDEFRQVGRAGSSSGSGLGLTITKRLVDLLSGEVALSSRLGEGSVFTVTLPVEIPGRSASAADEAEAPADGIRTAIVLDSNPATLYVTKKYLAEAGYAVTATDDLDRAMQIARSSSPSVIAVSMDSQEAARLAIQDLSRELAGHVTNNGTGRLIAIVSGTDTEQQALEAGASAVVRRPFDRADLIRAMERALSPSTRHVLVVDDDQDALDLVTEMLEGTGFEARTAQDGRKALDEIEKCRPDVVILDLMLPEMDGFEVIDRMLLRADWKNVPVILVTARDLSHEERRALDIATVRIIQKGGFTRDELLAEINLAIGEKRISGKEVKIEAAAATPAVPQAPPLPTDPTTEIEDTRAGQE